MVMLGCKAAGGIQFPASYRTGGRYAWDIGSLELAIGRRLGRKQRRVGPANAQFDMLPFFGVNTDTRRQANRGCRDLPLNEIEFTVSWIARASG